jgi:RNA polymerase sigma-70 factor, ECF subfamily
MWMEQTVSVTWAEPAMATDAVELLVREHARMVYRIGYAVVRRPHDAEDIVQETFLRVLRHRDDLPRVRDQKAWLARIAWHIALDHKRARPPQLDDAAAVLAQLHARGAGADELLARDEMNTVLEALIASLPAELRQPLQLSVVSELGSAEIAEVLAIAEGTVRTRLMRARQVLKTKLGQVLEKKS